MRHEPTEIRLARATPRRRQSGRAFGPRSSKSGVTAAEPAPAATEVIDEAFAGLSRSDARVRRVDSATSEYDGTAGARGRAPLSLAVVSQLTAQLDALDRQRRQLAQLLRELDVESRDD